MTDERHGDAAGAKRHRRRGEKPCASCLKGENIWRQDARRKEAQRKAGGVNAQKARENVCRIDLGAKADEWLVRLLERDGA